MSVVIVGGGLAGISAAIALQESGVPVTLVESRPWLGGATHSFTRGDLSVDNGQHVFLRCCSAYQGLLRRLRADHLVDVQDRFDVPVLRAGAEPARLRRSPLPSPLHLLPALAGYAPLSPADRLRAVRAAAGLRRLDPADPALDTLSAGAWLAQRGQRPWVRDALWGLFITSALNAEVDEAALGLSAMVCRRALFGRADAADIGLPLVPLEELHGGPALRRIAEMGGTVRLKAKVEAVTTDPKVVVDGTPIAADAVILAVPHEAAARLLPAQALPEPLRWAELDASPIVNVHVVYDRKVTDFPLSRRGTTPRTPRDNLFSRGGTTPHTPRDNLFAAAVGSPVQWVFDRTAVSGLRRGQYLAVSLSAADRWIDMPTARIRSRFVPELRRLLPAAWDAEVRELFVTRERRATFRQRPGSAAARPGPVTRAPGLFLAARGPTRAGRTRWRARCAAVSPPPTWSAAISGARAGPRRG
ncbi:hydroxysqualene dehydroxylase HpnE [Actinomadura madurae]|uniref:hydroxysqualene dehydroxylase HpnE n=1 Tax=Actinomadura madurae TaxID=1993 RepID=UPI0020D1FDBE|nr:hydroxysqualene dehydroxylase HpnE [Actinomadura madurae]MCQ0014574.1 hydroxysqualene dehydroxylase HpnE [Actinomadura madurae]